MVNKIIYLKKKNIPLNFKQLNYSKFNERSQLN